jgi:hypothetical protein
MKTEMFRSLEKSGIAGTEVEKKIEAEKKGDEEMEVS